MQQPPRKFQFSLRGLIIFVLVFGGLLGVGVWLVQKIAPIRQDPIILIQNRSGLPVEQITVWYGDGQRKLAKEISKLESDGEVRITLSTSDLYLNGIKFTQDGKEKEVSCGGLATPGETYAVQIGINGIVKHGYVFAQEP